MDDFFAKDWDPTFAKGCPLKNDEPFVESRREIFLKARVQNSAGLSLENGEPMNADENGIRIFLRDSDDSTALDQVDEVEEFCRGVSLADLKSGSGPAGFRRAAWIDERQILSQKSGGEIRKHRNPLTATAFYRALKEPRFLHCNLPDANRRLLYVQNLDRHYILALMETAPAHQVPALREMIRYHLAHRISIRVHMRTKSYTTFHLDLHIPYFEFRKFTLPSVEKETSTPSLSRQSTDLSFLDMPTSSTLDEKGRYIVQKACFSFTICGSDDQHYIGYAFVDRALGPDEKLEEEDFSCNDLQQDPIASDCEEDVLDANLPLWDPRVYFLSIFESRIAKILKEWESLARIIESRINVYETRYSPTVSCVSDAHADRHVQNVKHALHWNENIIKLLNQLLHVLSGTVDAWDMFRSPNDGDHRYFKNVNWSPADRRKVIMSFRSIAATFETLKSVQRNLLSLEKRCQKSAEALTLHLAVESNKATKDTVFTAEWTIQIFSPIALTIAFISMPQAVIPFEQNFKHFIITIVVLFFVVQLLFYAFGGRLRKSRFCKWTATWIKAFGFEGAMGECGSAVLPPRRRNSPDPSLEDIEMIVSS